ncbi:MAG: AarF/ABC1/UbiB kinase family protein [Myxococcales bacterium]|nr:AarF/ABC1/UbiB kinase family protein [Myxococcales bacterium]
MAGMEQSNTEAAREVAQNVDECAEVGASPRSRPIAESYSAFARVPAEQAAPLPPSSRLRFLRAYWTTFVVIASYLSLRFQSRFRSEDSIARILREKNRRNARRIERTIRTLQGLFIKVGQLISIMTNFLPAEFLCELEGLQDNVPPRRFEKIAERIREEFDGKSPLDLFATFEERPIASASVGQVHRATLRDGTQVAVKVQYPGIESVVRSDLRTLRRIFSIVGHFVHYEGLSDMYREIRLMILEELDFELEAENCNNVKKNFVGRTDVCFPTVVNELSTARVLTTHFECGVKIADLSALDAIKVDRSELARLVVESYCQQIFTDGIYHADPHPGNLLVRNSRTTGLSVVFIDFGAVARVSPEMRRGIADLVTGAITNDSQRIVKAMRSMGFVAKGGDEALFERVVEYFHAYFQEQISFDTLNLKDIKFDPQKSLENLADLRRMDISFRELTANFHVPKEWILLERTLLLLMGLCTALDPSMNPMLVIRPYLERFVLGDDGDWSTLVVDTTKDVAVSVAALPGDVRKFLKQARTGDLSVRFQNLDRNTDIIYRLGHQAMIVSIGIASAAIAIVLEGRGDMERAKLAWWVAKGAGAFLTWSLIVTHGLRRRR